MRLIQPSQVLCGLQDHVVSPAGIGYLTGLCMLIGPAKACDTDGVLRKTLIPARIATRSELDAPPRFMDTWTGWTCQGTPKTHPMHPPFSAPSCGDGGVKPTSLVLRATSSNRTGSIWSGVCGCVGLARWAEFRTIVCFVRANLDAYRRRRRLCRCICDRLLKPCLRRTVSIPHRVLQFTATPAWLRTNRMLRRVCHSSLKDPRAHFLTHLLQIPSLRAITTYRSP